MNRALLLLMAVMVVPGLHAQFDLGKMTKALDKAKSLAGDAGKVAKGVAGIGPKEEAVIGDSVALEIISRHGGLDRDEDATRRMNLVGRALASFSARPERDWRFGVLASPHVNAFSAPDGYVFITRGLYDLCGDDDRLAAVLGHEIAHVTGRHALRIIERGEFLGAVGAQVVQRSGDARELEAQLQQFDLGVTKIVETLLEKGFDPQTEYNADQEGHRLAVLCGYAPTGLRAVLTALQARGEDRGTMFSTHPAIKDRLKRLPAPKSP